MLTRSSLIKTLLIFGVFSILLTSVYAITFITNSEADFNNGTYSNTEYNSTGGYVQLSLANTSGNYTSQVFDAGSNAIWNNISWSESITTSFDSYLTSAMHEGNPIAEVFAKDESYHRADMKDLKKFYLNFTDNLINNTVLKIYAQKDLGRTVGIYAQTDTSGTNPLGNFIVTSGSGEWHNITLDISTPTNAIWLGEGTGSGNDPKDYFDYIYAEVSVTANLNLTVRSCDDENCSGESWININDTSPQDLSLDNNTYFQYKAYFETDVLTYSPLLYNVTIDYTLSEDTTPPASVTNLANQSAGTTWIYWNWTNPGDADFDEAIVYLDGSNLQNTSNNYYNATNLSEDTSYTITVHTKDTSGNVNNTDVNSTAETLAIVLYCGDGSCNGDETCSSCSADCGSCTTGDPGGRSPGGGGSSSGYYNPSVPAESEEAQPAEEPSVSGETETPGEEEGEEVFTGFAGEAIRIAPSKAPNPFFAVPTILLMVIFVAVIAMRHSDISKRAKKILIVAHGSLILMIAFFIMLSFKSLITDYFNLVEGNILDISGSAVTNFTNNPLPIIALIVSVVGLVSIAAYMHKIYKLLKK